MTLADVIREYLEEFKKQGYKAVKVKQLVELVVKTEKCHPQSIYNALRMLEMKGEIKTSRNVRGKIIILE